MRTRLYLPLLIAVQSAVLGSPSIQFDNTSTSVEVPPLLRADRANAVFRFTNVSDQPVSISKIVPSCDCIKVDYTHGDLSAGAHGVVSLSIPLTSGTGTFVDSVHVVPSAGDPVDLTISITIPLSATADASKLVWKAGERGEKTLTIKAAPFTSIRVEGVSIADGTAAAAVVEETVPGSEYRIRFKPVTDDPEFYTTASINLTTATDRRVGMVIFLRRVGPDSGSQAEEEARR